MGVDRSLVVGYGFIVTEEEAEAFNDSLDEPHDGTYEALFHEVEEKNPAVQVHSIGNQWEGDVGYLIAIESSSTETYDDYAISEPYGMRTLRNVYPEDSVILFALMSRICPDGHEDRFVGWNAGIYTY